MLIIRPAQHHDLPVLSQIEARCFQHYQLGRQQFSRFLRHQTAAILVAQKGETVCGHVVVLFRRNSKLARLYSIAIDQPYRQSNIGTELLKQAEECVRQRGLEHLILEVSQENEAARKFYLKHGFVEQKVFQNYYEDGLHAYRMNKYLQ